MVTKLEAGVERDLGRVLEAVARAFVDGSEDDRRRVLDQFGLRSRPSCDAQLRVWLAREMEIRGELEERAKSRSKREYIGASTAFVMEVLRVIAGTIGPGSQRMTRTRAEALAPYEGLSTAQKAFTELVDAGVLLAPVKVAYSTTWEIDARYCSALDDAGREAAILAQAAMRAALVEAEQSAAPPPSAAPAGALL